MDGFIPPTRRAHEDAWPLSGWGQHPSGAWSPDGGTVGPAVGSGAAGGPRFDAPVPLNGYAWWYVDALSDDGRYGITLIAFIGSVFSPYYAFRRRSGRIDPLDHCALNVALYGGGQSDGP